MSVQTFLPPEPLRGSQLTSCPVSSFCRSRRQCGMDRFTRLVSHKGL